MITDKQKQACARHYQKKLASGKCVKCKGPRSPTSVLCEKCINKCIKRSANKRAQWKAGGLCARCGKQRDTHLVTCSKCTAITKRNHKAWSTQLRISTINKYGGKCKCCGQSNIKYLQIDHINGGGKKERQKNPSTYFWKKLLEEPIREDLQVLCANCHMAKTWFGGCSEEDHPPP